MNNYEITDELFKEIKEAAIKIWKTYDNTYGYATEKIDQVENIENFKDNWTSIVGMFDFSNQEKLISSLEGEAKKIVYEITNPNRLAATQLKELGIFL